MSYDREDDVAERKEGGRDAKRPARGADPQGIAVLVLLVLALVFIFENTRDTEIRLLVPLVTMPLWLALLARASSVPWSGRTSWAAAASGSS